VVKDYGRSPGGALQSQFSTRTNRDFPCANGVLICADVSALFMTVCVSKRFLTSLYPSEIKDNLSYRR